MRSHIPLTFPSTRKALWSHTAIGDALVLRCPRVSVSVSEQVLYLAYGVSRTAKTSHCLLGGAVHVEADCSEMVVYIDQLEAQDTAVDGSTSVSPFRIPTKLERNSRHTTNTQLEVASLEDALQHLTERARQGRKIDVAEFVYAYADCTVFAGSNQIRADLDVDIILPNVSFEATPIDPVNIAATALSKSVLGADKHGVVSNQAKSGYLTMDQYRKVIFLLESDPKVLTVPIIGIWVSGVELLTHPYIWASCLRYMHTTAIRDRVAKPNQPFLLIYKSSLMNSTQHFDCLPSATSLSYQLLSGGQTFSMHKEVSGKRNGKMSVKAECRELSSPRGRQFLTVMQELMEKREIENRSENSSREVKVTEKLVDDSLPWCSPLPSKLQGHGFTPSVPDVTLLDESNPLDAPQPQRMALHRITDSRLNCSPMRSQPPADLRQPSKQETPIARKIKFGEVTTPSNEKRQAPKAKPFLTTPSLRTAHPLNSQPQDELHWPTPPSPIMSHTPALTCTPSHLTSNIPAYEGHDFLPEKHGDPLLQQLTDASRQPLPAQHVCPCCRQRSPLTNPLTVITENVQRLLSPRREPTQPTYQSNISPIAVEEQTPCHSTAPFTPSAASGQTVPISPEVDAILKQQDAQLKSLQQQIQKLLNAQDRPADARQQKTAETQTTNAVAVNTGASLFECNDFNSQSGFQTRSDTQDSAHDSSRSQSLIQHDLTALDLPTQGTARSFTSDINVDYESYEDSLTGSPKRDSCQSMSEDSWQSPVLGESVSMMAECVNPASAKQQLDVIIRNVQGLLAGPTATQEDVADRDVSDVYSSSDDEPPCDVDTQHKDALPVESTAVKDVASATRVQLRKMGIDVDTPTNTLSGGDMLPRVQYLSMVMTDTTLSDANRSIEMNALALKYLKDEQLTELAHLTVHKDANRRATEGSLLRQVLMTPKEDSTNHMPQSNMSMATQQYLKRYELDQTTSEVCNHSHMSAAVQLADSGTVDSLKSILRKVTELPETSNASHSKEMSLQVLDIARLKELPKLL